MNSKPETGNSKLETYRTDFWLILILFISFRFLTLLLLKPGGFIRDWSDFDTYLGIAALSDYGLFPYLDFWLEWPPVIPWLMVGAYKLSLLMPAWEDHRFWFVTILGAVFVLFEAGNLALIYRLARRILPDPNLVTRVLWMYALLFPPVYAMLGFFDGAALFFILLSLELILANKTRWAAVVSGAGFAVKLTPILTAGVAGWYLWHKHKPNWRRIIIGWAQYGAIFVATVALLLLPFWPAEAQWLAAAFRATLGRSSWETVWAVLEGYYSFGVVLGDRLNPAETTFAVHPATLPWTLISLGFAALYLALFFRKVAVAQPRRVIAFAGLTTTLFLLYSKGYSPQFLVYILPFIVLLRPNFTGVSYALVLTLLNVIEQPIYFVMLPDEHWLLTVIVIARFIIFVALAIEFAAIIYQLPFINYQLSITNYQLPTINLGWLDGMRIVVLGGTLLALLTLTPKGMGAYQQTQLARSPYRNAIAFLETQASEPRRTLILTEQTLYRQLRPHLRGDYRLKLAGGDAQYPGAPPVGNLLAGETSAWLLAGGPQGEAIRAQADSVAQAAARYQLNGLGELTLYNSEAILPTARAENGLELVSHQLDMPTSTVVVTLFWQAAQAIDTDYTVFTQILDANGAFIAGHDGLPAAGSRPTSTWLPNAIIPDTHLILLPPNLPPGNYRLAVGMYDSTGARLPFANANGQPFADGAVLLDSITLP